jgi:hypothetical protein
VTVALVALVLWSSVGGVAGTPPGQDADQTAAVSAESPGAVQIPATNGTNGSVVRHENPASADTESRPGRVAATLLGRLVDRHRQSVVALDDEEFRRARRVLGDDYGTTLATYADVVGAAGVRNHADVLQTTRLTQRGLVNATAEYRATYRQYLEARQTGDTQLARRLAREIDAASRNVSRLSHSLRRQIRTVDDLTTRDLGRTVRQIQAVNGSVQERRRSVLDREFVETDLAVAAVDRNISFRDPLVLRGRLRAANGTAIATASVGLRVAGENYTVRTDRRGRFQVRHRPTTLPRGRHPLTVRYVPNGSTVYRVSEATVPVTVEETAARITVLERSATARYGRPVLVRGRVAVDGLAVPDVPVTATVGGQRLGTVRTDEDGGFEVRTGLPAAVPAGNRTVRTNVPLSGRAIATRTERSPLAVDPTPTSVAIDGTRVGNASVRVDGRLATGAGEPVPARTVLVEAGGRVVGTARTGPRGDFRAFVPRDAVETPSNGSLWLVVRHDGSGSSLESAAARRQVSLGGRPGAPAGLVSGLVTVALGGSGLGGSSPTTLLSVLGVAIITFITGSVYRGLRRLDTPGTGGESYPDREQPPVADTDAGSDGPERRSHGLEQASELLDAGRTDAAITTAYFAVRDRFGGDGWENAGHWRFHEHVTATADDVDAAAFRRLTLEYERAAFAAGAVSVPEARAAVESARTVLEQSP